MRTRSLPVRRSVVLPVALLAMTLWPTLSSTSRAQAVERVIYASVLDAAGKPVTGVQPADVAVREDGVAREVLRIAPATEPMQVALLVDNSASSASEIVNIRDAIKAFIAALAGTHAVSIVGIADRPTVLADSTTDRIALKRGVGRLFTQSNAGMYLLDAIVETSRGFRKREAARPVIVSITTEGVEFSHARHQDVLEALAEGGAAYHAFLMTRAGSDQSSDEARERNLVLDRGTREFGGNRKELLTSMALEESLLVLADELNTQVAVTFARPQSLIPPQKTTIEAAAPGLTVRGAVARTYTSGSPR
jgi:hypothetical protein